MNDETRIVLSRSSRIGVGTVLNEVYAVDSLIGTGGMGEVYRGHEIGTGEQVAIKTIRAEHAQNADAIALFRKEARALHKLVHDAIVRYYVFTIDRQVGLPYLAMEYVGGQSLSDILRERKLGVDEIAVLLRRAASGLHAAHGHGIIHRDVSPDNIIVPDGNFSRAKIIDFGIARSGEFGDATVIGSGFAGKFSYVSPEQLGLFDGDVTPRSDIYSLGLVIAHALLGRPVDMGRSQVDVIEKRRRVPPELAEIDGRVRPILQRMLQPNPRDRPADMAAVAAWAPPPPRRSRSRAVSVAAGAAAALLLAAGAGWFVWPDVAGWLPGLDAPTDTQPAPAPGRVPDRPEAAAPPPTPAIVEPSPAPAPAEPPPPRQPVTIESVAAFVRGYRGGTCFFATPASVSRREAVIEAFGTSPEPFVAFDAEFQKTFGFEPEISLRQVTNAQCPVVDLLISQSEQRSSRVPRVTIRSDRLRNGEELAGSVDYRADAGLDVLFVGDDGQAYSLAGYLKRSGEQVTFNLRLEARAGSTEPKPQLVVAVASPRPLASLKGVASQPIDQVLRRLREEAARTGQQLTVAVRYLKLGG